MTLQLDSEGYKIINKKKSVKELVNKEAQEQEKKYLEFEKLKYDVKNSKRIFETYWWTFRLAVAGFLLALGKIIFDFLKR